MDSRRSITQHDLSVALGLSHSTISRALRDHPLINKETRERVQKLAREMGYQPDPVLSALMVYRSGMKSTAADRGLIAVLDPNSPFSAREGILSGELPGIRTEAASLGYRVEIFPIDADPAEQARLSRILFARGIRGVLVGPMPPGKFALTGFDWSLFSAVALGYSLRQPALHFIAQDHDGRCQMVYRRLREMGYKRIGYANRITIEQNNRHLMLGAYLKSLFLDGISADELSPLLYDNHLDLDPVPWIRKHKFDAVMVGMGEEFETALNQSSLRPSQYPLIACNIISKVRYPVLPKWPGGVEDLRLVGAAAVKLLHQLLCHGDRGIPEQRQAILIDGAWSPGHTPAPPRRKTGRRKTSAV